MEHLYSKTLSQQHGLAELLVFKSNDLSSFDCGCRLTAFGM